MTKQNNARCQALYCKSTMDMVVVVVVLMKLSNTFFFNLTSTVYALCLSKSFLNIMRLWFLCTFISVIYSVLFTITSQTF